MTDHDLLASNYSTNVQEHKQLVKNVAVKKQELLNAKLLLGKNCLDLNSENKVSYRNIEKLVGLDHVTAKKYVDLFIDFNTRGGGK